jgi:hypothetical protein
MRPGKFDRLFTEGRQALLSGTHQVQSAPADGLLRWGISVILRPDPLAAQAIEHTARAAAAVVGDHHWLAGAATSSHLTLRSGFEPFRNAVLPGDPLVARLTAALHAAAATLAGPLRFAITGLTLTPTSVMACAIPAGPAAADLDAAFCAALRAGGQADLGRPPDIWYLNLVYFTGQVRDAQALIDWVAARREMAVTDVLITAIQLAQWRHTPAGMRPHPLASATPSQPAS